MNTKLIYSNDNMALCLRDKIKKTEFKGNKIINDYEYNSFSGKSIQHNLFRNTWIAYYDLKIPESKLFTIEENGEIRFNYCISGRCEFTYKNNKVIYIGNGDFISAFLDYKSYQHDFPLEIYKGFTIVTTLQDLDVFLNKIFSSERITGKSFIDKLKSHDNFLLFSNNDKIKSIMEELFYLDDAFWKEKSIIALTQLVVFLLSDDNEACIRTKKYIDTNLSNKVKHIKEKVTKNIEQYTSIEQISKIYGISSRTFSECFKEVYGNTYYAFIKEYRVKKAAELLAKNKQTITEIALSVGYQNPGKFSKAFCEVMGTTPLKFRKNLITGLD